MSSDKKHALLSPSGAHKWLVCNGSLAMEKLAEPSGNTTSADAEEGTAAHHVLEILLTGGKVEVGDVMPNGIRVDDDMMEYMTELHQVVLGMSEGKILMAEQSVDFSAYTDIPEESFGTSDIIIVDTENKELQVHDLKYGMYQVDAGDNEQLMLYALGAYDALSMIYDIDKVRMVIHQPRIKHVSESVIPAGQLLEFGEHVRDKAAIVMACIEDETEVSMFSNLTPGEKQCHYCRAKALCPALADYTFNNVASSFDDLDALEEEKGLKDGKATAELLTGTVAEYSEAADKLGAYMDAVGLIEDWCSAIRARVAKELFAGNEVPGYKVVAGRKGPRQWADDDVAEQAMKRARIVSDVMYTKKVITAPQAEKALAKSKPRIWANLQNLIVQNDGKPSVAPMADKRPAIQLTDCVSGFDNLDDINN